MTLDNLIRDLTKVGLQKSKARKLITEYLEDIEVEHSQERITAYKSGFQYGRSCENRAWLEDRRCQRCGKGKSPNLLSDTCTECWEIQ